MNSAAPLPVAMSLIVLCGAAFMTAAIFAGLKLTRQIPDTLQGRWNFMTLLMNFFLAGYLLFFSVLVGGVAIPTELITAPVFLAGAVFVYIVIRLTQLTVEKLRQVETNLRVLNEKLEDRVAERTRDLDLLNESLERQVAKRTRDLRESREFLQTVLDSMSDEVLIIDAGSMGVVQANAAFLERHGLRAEAIVGRPCYEVAHQRQTICEPPDLPCPLADTLASGGFSTAEHCHRYPDGHNRFVEVTSSPITDAGGKIVRLVHVIRDRTERKQAEQVVRESEERYRRVVEVSPDGISLHVDEKFVFVNPAGARLLGAKHPDQLIGMSFWRVIHPDSRSVEELRLQELGISADTTIWTEEKYVRLDGAEIDVEVVGVHYRYQGKTGVQTVFRDVTERKQVAQRVERLALYDTLTGLPNRTLFFDRIGRALAAAKRNRGTFALLFMDLDGFKEINDTLGHEAGDEVLRELSRRMVARVRQMDTIARVGGDEFVGITGPLTKPGDAGLMAQKLCDAVSEPVVLSGNRRSVGMSVGISIYPRDGEDAATLMSKADRAMYRAKKSGKDRFLFHEEAVRQTPSPQIPAEPGR